VTERPPGAGVILHITTPAAWAEAQAKGSYDADSLATEGFIHCSTADQLEWVLARHFTGRSGLIVLRIDAARVPAEIRHENLEGGTQLFPHVYGPIPCESVIEIAPVHPPL
jgi:uncharacterized protein (DUF952 family)